MFSYLSDQLTLRHSNFKLFEEQLSFDDILNELSSEFEDCKINTGTEYVMDETFRKGKQNWNNNICFNFDSIMVNKIHEQYPNWKIQIIKFHLLKYDIGGFFLPHVDHYQGKCKRGEKLFNHVATILVLPPIHFHPHSGAELKIYLNKNKNKTTTDTTDTTDTTETIIATDKWTIIIFKLGITHEVLKLTSGTRYVFKGVVYEQIA